MTLLTTALVAFVVSVLLTPLLRFAAHRLDLLDRPNERSSHVSPTPRTGGIAILAGMGVAAFAAGALLDRSLLVMMSAAALVALTGFIDDLWNLRAWQKFSGQLVATAVVLLYGALPRVISLPWRQIPPGLLVTAIAFLWIIGLTNAYNFMDGINGIATLQAVITSAALVVAILGAGDSVHRSDALVLSALAGAALGFLPFNFPRGSIFMGDVGSGAIGFLLAVMVLRGHPVPCAIPVALFSLFPFLFDSFVTFMRRLLKGEPVFSPHRSHFYQRLNLLGWSHVRVTLLWCGLSVVGSVLALATCRQPSALVCGAVLLLILHAVLGFLITRAERRQLGA